MKKLALVFLLSFLMSGCIDYTSTIKLNNDGSGTIEETVLMSDLFFQMMKSFAESFADTVLTDDDFSLFDEDQLKMQAGDMGVAVKYLSGEKVKINGKEGYKALFSFDDISGVRITENPDDKMPKDEMIENDAAAEKEEYITFNFTKGNPSILEINFPKEIEKNIVDENIGDSTNVNSENEMMDEQTKEFLMDFKVLMNLQINGNIVETNATFHEDNIITFLQMDFGKLMENPDKFDEIQKQEPESMREIKELIKNIPGFKVELNEKVIVKIN